MHIVVAHCFFIFLSHFVLFHKKHLTTIVFDLDNTLIDHAFAEKQAISKVLTEYHSHPHIGTALQSHQEQFLKIYRLNNERLWHDLSFRRITAEDLRWMRFSETLQDQALRDKFPVLTSHQAEALGKEIGDKYLQLYKYHWRLLDGANELLSALQGKYKLGVITNGFTDQQRGKLNQFGWTNRFHDVILSEEVGVMKPHREIFELAEQRLGTHGGECVYVGDNYISDVQGAKNAGWSAVWLNAGGTPVPIDNCADATVQTLEEVRNLFL